MASYKIQTATWNDMDDLQSLAADSLRNFPIANALLTDAQNNLTNTVHSRHTLAHYIYAQALHAQDAPNPNSKVLKAINTQTPTQDIQACAWLQWLPTSPEHPNSNKISPELPTCINSQSWQSIQSVKRTHQEILTHESAHYLLTSLDLTPNICGQHAARALLSRIHAMDTEHPIIAFTKLEHEKLYEELGWLDGGSVVFDKVKPLGVQGRYCLRAYIRPGSGIGGGEEGSMEIS